MAESRAERKAREAAEKLANANPGGAAEQPNTSENSEGNVADQDNPSGEPGSEGSGSDGTGNEGSDTQQPEQPTNGSASRPVYDPLTNPLEYTELEAAAIRQGIADGHIITAPAAVTVRAKSSPTNKDESQPFTAYVAIDSEGCVILAGGKEEGATSAPDEGDDTRTEAEKAYGMVDYFNHGYYLKRWNNTIRDMLLESIAGPEKEIAKRVKSLLEGKLAKTEQQARGRVIRMRVIEGLLVPEKDMVAFLEREKITADQLEAWRAEHIDD